LRVARTMKINEYGTVQRSQYEIIDLLYTKENIENIVTDLHTAEQFVLACEQNTVSDNLIHVPKNYDITVEEFDQSNQKNWYYPTEYDAIDLDEYLLDLCESEQERERTRYELSVFRKKGLEKLLRYLLYLIHTCRANNIVWGVGRGSSVASYVLFLIGVHKIDSIKYNIEFKEFIKDA
jgi:DNA polymerase III alpha subunit